jgi:WD40 repeat protein
MTENQFLGDIILGWDCTNFEYYNTPTAFDLSRSYRGVLAASWSPDGKRIASGSWDTTVQVWNATTGQRPSDDEEYIVRLVEKVITASMETARLFNELAQAVIQADCGGEISAA